MPPSKPSLRDAIQQHLLAHGPSSADDIHRALIAAEITSAKTPAGVRSSLTGSRFAFQLPDDRWDLTTRALAGVVLTVRPRSRIRHNVLWVHGDLEPFDALLTGDTIPLTSGGLVRRGGGRIRTLIGPDGWLPDVAPGELIALRWNGHALEVFAVDARVPADATQIQALLRSHLASLRHDRYSTPSLVTVLLSALREDPELFCTPQLPLSEVFPLPQAELTDTSPWEGQRDGRRLTLHLPHRVYDERERRARLLGEDLADHAAVLLGAASDRVKVEYRAYDLDRYDYRDDPDWLANEVVRPLRSIIVAP